eukprot:CAMPEP_0194367640 /NCGR_PEP_ID=MMETSP0174-20130528/15763_1 /TAXON_ID=216777 /ORGANISM="Proboscia alata, Strain PI-D3" /LENGTH=642 /DNA_ID=CAMNT_0039143521 /DNA_START=151 /DNA_END=2079 /DNA_ORIENTATION=-
MKADVAGFTSPTARSLTRLLRILKDPAEASSTFLEALRGCVNTASVAEEIERRALSGCDDPSASRGACGCAAGGGPFDMVPLSVWNATHSQMTAGLDTMGRNGWGHPPGIAEERMICCLLHVLDANQDGDGNGDGDSNDLTYDYNIENDMNTSLALLATLLESLNLQISSRTTRVWGHQKSFEVFGLPGKVRHVSGRRGLDKLRLELKREFCAYFGGEDDKSNSCRVYARITPLKDGVAVGSHAQSSRSTSSTNVDASLDGTESRTDARTKVVYIQIIIGHMIVLDRDGDDMMFNKNSHSKKGKNHNEFLALVLPGTDVVVLSAKGAPSRSRYTPYVLAALGSILCESNGDCGNSNDPWIESKETRTTAKTLNNDVCKRIGTLEGKDPIHLLNSALISKNRWAMGRFASAATTGDYHSNDFSTASYPDDDPDESVLSMALSDPILELNRSSLGGMSCRASENKRLKTSSKHGVEMANRATAMQEQPQNNAGGKPVSTTLVACNSAGLIVDHDAEAKQQLKTIAKSILGTTNSSDTCPRRILWKWSGYTNAPFDCCKINDNDDHNDFSDDDDDDDHDAEKNKRQPIQFKCGVTMEGKNIFEGIRALIENGMLAEGKTDVPDFVRDAPLTAGTSGVVTVVNNMI